MKKIKNIVIGFGKGGKTLAVDLGSRGEETLLIEKDSKMYGGTCINVACLPTKNLLNHAENRKNEEAKNYYRKSIQAKNELIAKLNHGNYKKVNETDHVQVVDGEASFIDNHTIRVGDQEFFGERIFINTGARPILPAVEGLEIGGRIYTSETLMDEEDLPEHLAILGSGRIGLEFANIYQQFGAQVTVISRSKREDFLADEDLDIAQLILEDLEESGIDFLFEADMNRVDLPQLSFEDGRLLETDALLVATGRHPNTTGLALENTDISFDDKRGIEVNDHLQTTVPHIYALGDVRGGLQQTYISLDDYRIVRSHLFEEGAYSLSDREVIPSTVFLTPPLSRVGHNEKSAREAGLTYDLKTLAVADIPKAKVLGQTKGLFKVLIDPENDQILGASLYGAASQEIINTLAVAMTGKLPAALLSDHIFTHPTLSESFNDLF